MKRAVYYCELLQVGADSTTLDLQQAWQIEQSVSSLRQFNPSIPVYFLGFGCKLPQHLEHLMSKLNIEWCYLGDPDAYLQGLVPYLDTTLVLYPQLWFWLGLPYLRSISIDQVLCLSSHTYIFNDLTPLFETYSTADWISREAAFSQKSRQTYNQGYLNESALTQLMKQAGGQPLPPLSTDIVLLNHQFWQTLVNQLPQLVTYVWQFSIHLGMTVNDAPDLVAARRERQRYLEPVRSQALPFPSMDANLRSQLALNLILSQCPDFSFDIFQPQVIFQDREFLTYASEFKDWIVGCYGSHDEAFWSQDFNQDQDPTDHKAVPMATQPGLLFKQRKYAMLPQLVQDPLLQVIYDYCLMKWANHQLSTRDPLIRNAPHAYADPLTEVLIQQVQPAIEAAIGLALFPTYSYLRIYQNGDELPPHIDRPSSEFTVTLMIGGQSEGAWPIYMDTQPQPLPFNLNPGDALVYRGCEIRHWRQPFVGHHQVQVFLGYVDQHGPFSEWKWDKRPQLGHQESTS